MGRFYAPQRRPSAQRTCRYDEDRHPACPKRFGPKGAKQREAKGLHLARQNISARLPRNFRRKPNAINKSAKISQHTFVRFLFAAIRFFEKQLIALADVGDAAMRRKTSEDGRVMSGDDAIARRFCQGTS
jgi:hypothetical protein